MTLNEILRLRLANQQLVSPEFKTPGDLVGWMGAVQAQEYLLSLWAIGQRLNARSVESGIEKAIAEKQIVRSWPMRGTLHFVVPADLRWMLELLTPRVIARNAKIYRDSGIDKALVTRCTKVLEKALRDDLRLTRDQLYEVFAKNKIPADGQRGLHIIGYLAQQGLICIGPRIGKQHTFVLLDEWIAPTKSLTRDEALARLTERYFRSHGPATQQDLVWWSGLTVADVSRGIDIVRHKFSEEVHRDVRYWFDPTISSKGKSTQALLLPVYDEYAVGYCDRDILVDPDKISAMRKIGNLVFVSPVVIGGKVVAVWRRTIQKDEAIIEVNSLSVLSQAQKDKIQRAAKNYGYFIGLDARVKYTKQFSYSVKK